MKYLYIDESGVPTNPLDKYGKLQPRTPRVFCLGGIVVEERQKQFLENEHKRLFKKYFPSHELTDFKLHYHELREGSKHYAKLEPEKLFELTHEIFGIIQRSDATLLSVTIDLIEHYKTDQSNLVSPHVLALISLLDRFFHYVISQNNDNTSIIYERFDRTLRKRAYEQYLFLQKTEYGTKSKWGKIIKLIRDGDPIKEPVLQFADFWTYLPFAKEKGHLDIQDFAHMYYRFDDAKIGGNVTIRSKGGSWALPLGRPSGNPRGTS